MSEKPAPPTRVSILNQETIVVGSNLSQSIITQLLVLKASTYVFVTDANVAPLHLAKLHTKLESEISARKLGSRVLQFIIQPGEVNKTRETKAEVEDYMLSQSCTRDTCLIALGGGVIGDLVGFVASTFMRGIKVVQLPTTLLAMVDSSIGGKTGVDTRDGKNLVGAFHQPTAVFIDTMYLKTLPAREFVNGLAEVIKTAAIWCEDDFVMLENNCEKILGLSNLATNTFNTTTNTFNTISDTTNNTSHTFNTTTNTTNNTNTSNTTCSEIEVGSMELIQKLILGSVKVKAHVVTIDEKEGGLRGLLNFGHTVGHAIEAIVFPDLLHGECISIGMVIEAEISRHLGHLSNVCVGRLIRCLQSYGLPVSFNDTVYKSKTLRSCVVDRMMDIMKIDKKNQGHQKRIVLLAAIGRTYELKASDVDDKIIRRILSPAIQIIPIDTSTHTTLDVPGSKSMSNRALVMAALGRGPCRLRGLLHSDDVQVMLVALQKLVGIQFKWEDGGHTLLIIGGEGRLRVPDTEIYLGNAGTASRFLTTVCTLIKSPDTLAKCTILTGNNRMKQRPIGPLIAALNSNGSEIQCLESKDCFPLLIKPDGLKGGEIKLAASISSQFVSSILISAPYADTPITLDLSNDTVISQPYIDMTIAMMKSFGIVVEREEGSNKYLVPLGVYLNPPEYLIEAGDAAFAVKVLREMGCIVDQTSTTTTVTGPKTLKPIPVIDMESMTDAFMTASILAAVACNQNNEDSNVTRITGIANQRVKECDRIAAMIIELGHLGVKASELPDGIEIHGIDRSKLVNPSRGIKCYDDHRIAMSFSVLACAYPTGNPGPIITEKRCVAKTWPSWWDALQNTLGVETIGVDLICPADESKETNNRLSIILIGMRGAGKTHMGVAASRILQKKFIDMDEFLENSVGLTIPQYIEQNGWEQFRAKEADCLDLVMKDHGIDKIIACGGGVIENQVSRDCLKKWGGVVVHIKRDIESIEQHLNVDKSRPMYGEDMRDVWTRREPYYDECSNAEFLILTPSNYDTEREHYLRVENDFARFLDFKQTKIPYPFPLSDLSCFVSLPCPNVNDILPLIEKISAGAEALELRVDLLECNDHAYVGQQIALLRHASSLPIVYTVRTQSQGGRFPDSDFAQMISLLHFGLKCGCEYIDVEFRAPMSRYTDIIKNKGGSRLIGSFHDVKGTATWGPNGSMIQIFREIHPHADVIKLIGRAVNLENNFDLYRFVNDIVPNCGLSPKPLISVLMGPMGQLSRSLNMFLTPVTHPDLLVTAAPGQVSIRQIHTTRHNIGLLPEKNFCLFGAPITHSMSPTIHNTGFKILGLPYSYTLYETGLWNEVKEAMIKMDGASVTIPLKVHMLKNNICDYVDESAKRIGAINTLYKNVDGKIHGANTDWIGIKRCIDLYLTHETPAIGVVIGAGGTSRAAIYALSKIPQIREIRIWNRTTAKAQLLADEFSANAVGDLKDCLKAHKKTNFVVISCVPAAAQEQMDVEDLFSHATEYSMGVIVDMAYRPRNTLLLREARAQKEPWYVVEGIQVLLEQGYEQFRIWTGKPAPKSAIIKEVFAKY